ncbi:PDZ domain-containing protein [Burkholderia orbicola]|uniref:PDZ domain-containing protein n=1 Tax=Burkholderia orbicola TaxID=2978683 RepID=UPI002FE0074D
MSLNTSAALKTAAVIGVVWGYAFFSNANGSLDATRERFGFAPALIASAGQEYGMTLSDTAPRTANAPDGPVVTAITPGGIADQNKLHTGDVIVAVDSMVTHHVSGALKYLKYARDERDGHYHFIVFRDGMEVDPMNIPRTVKTLRPANAPVGLIVNYDGDRPDSAPKGSVVMNVGYGSLAADAGVKVGDVITAVNGTPETGDNVFYKLSYNLDEKHIPPIVLTIWRDGQTSTLKLR